MILDFFTGKEIKDDGQCDNCKYNVGYKKDNTDIIWCDKYISYRYKMNCRCDYYKFILGGNEK